MRKFQNFATVQGYYCYLLVILIKLNTNFSEHIFLKYSVNEGKGITHQMFYMSECLFTLIFLKDWNIYFILRITRTLKLHVFVILVSFNPHVHEFYIFFPQSLQWSWVPPTLSLRQLSFQPATHLWNCFYFALIF